MLRSATLDRNDGAISGELGELGELNAENPTREDFSLPGQLVCLR